MTPPNSRLRPSRRRNSTGWPTSASLASARNTRAAVQHVQPYRTGDEAFKHPLAVLASLSNTDKHRIVNPTFSALTSEGLVDELEKFLGLRD